MGALEAPLSSEPWFGDGLTSDLLLHLLPLLTGHHKVYMLCGDVLTESILLYAEIYRYLMEMMGVRIIFALSGLKVKLRF